MKAKIKGTGEVLDVVDILLRSGNNCTDVFCIEDVEIINDTPTAEICSAEPDWEARRWQAAVAAMQGIISNSDWVKSAKIADDFDEFKERVSLASIEIADTMISELKKQKP